MKNNCIKKIKIITVCATLLVLTLLSCKAKESMKEYIEQGFAKPQMQGDAHFNEQSIGDGGVVYVPSAKEVELQFNIKNKYNQELTGEVSIPEGKEKWFSKKPELKELTPTKMVVAFNFKEEAEPSSTNSFLGESVGITVKIYEKKTGRPLSHQTVATNCNTPPEPIDKNNITYRADTDKYEILLPSNAGKHNDLKEVHFLFSTKYNPAEQVNANIVSMWKLTR